MRFMYDGGLGVSWRHDAIDWLGGFPYEVATSGEVPGIRAAKVQLCTNKPKHRL